MRNLPLLVTLLPQDLEGLKPYIQICSTSIVNQQLSKEMCACKNSKPNAPAARPERPEDRQNLKIIYIYIYIYIYTLICLYTHV